MNIRENTLEDFRTFYARDWYGLDAENITEANLQNVYSAHRDLYDRVIACLDRDEDVISFAINLYREKERGVKEAVLDGELDDALFNLEYMSLILRFIRRESEAAQENAPEFDIHEKMRGIRDRRRGVLGFKDDPIYALEQRLGMLVQEERYEKAAEVRDQLEAEKRKLEEAFRNLVGDLKLEGV